MALAETLTRLAVGQDTLVTLLRQRAVEHADRVAYTFLSEGDEPEKRVSYDQLDQQARSIAAHLQSYSAAGERVLLLYPPGLDYIAAFFGCMYAGAIAVPAYPPRRNRSLERLRAIVSDAQAAFALTTDTIYSRVQPLLAETPDLLAVKWLATDRLSFDAADNWRDPRIDDASIAFLQYTSGSTSTPKGVMVTHRNLLQNQEMIRRAFRQSSESVIAGWLPMYHDMGLIGNVLQPMFLGVPCILLSPASFLQQPARWLQTITQYQATTSGGPNFAYDLCVNKISDEVRATLDLSSWTCAFNGAEPVRADTMKRFADAFEPCGFNAAAFHPCYGLAEATLIVTGGRKSESPLVLTLDTKSLEQGRVIEDPAGRELVSCGEVTDEQRIAIVNPQTERACAAGEVGEVWVSGPGVAAGYWNRAGATVETFGATLDDRAFLRTGDLGFISAGELFITGRIKDLIVVRGRNHYPQDLELTMQRSHRALRPGCGAAFSLDVDGEERLVLVQELDVRQRPATDAVIEDIKRAIFEEHEIAPYAIALLKAGSIPKTSSGKIQRHACRAEFQQARWEVVDEWREAAIAAIEETAETPRNVAEIETWLASHLAAKLGLKHEQIDLHRPVTSYGLDSLVALDWMHAIEQKLGVGVSLSTILDSPSIAELAQHLSTRLPSKTPLVQTSQSTGDAPLSRGQEAMWFLHQLAPESAAYNLAFAARVEGDVDTSNLLGPALEDLISRHPSLRTTFHSVDGRPVQRVHEHRDAAFSEVDATRWSEEQLDNTLAEEAHRPFDLEHGPLLRIHVYRRAHDLILLLTAHHIIVDFWSLAILVDELGVFYEARRLQTSAELAPLPFQYTDYQHWQHSFLNSSEADRLLAFWQERLSGELPVLDLTTDKPRPAQQTYSGASLRFKLSEKLTNALKSFGESRGATLYMTLLAAFQTLLHRHTGQHDILIGSPTTGRSHAELTGVAGYFVNPIVLRGRPSGDATFEHFLAQVRSDVLSAFEHQDYPFPLLVEKLQPQRDPSRSELFQAMFILHRSHLPQHQALGGFALGEAGTRMSWANVSLESISLKQRVSQFDLTLMMAELDGSLSGSLQYNTDLFDAASMQRLQDHFVTLLEGIVAQPDQQLSRLPLLTAAEEEQLITSWNQTQLDYPAHKTIHELFEEQVNRTPDAIALVRHHEQITFRELNSRANQIASELRALGVGPEVPVGICLRRSIRMVVALLGVLKAGGAYVPLDPAYPKPRVAFMLEDARAQVVITESHLLEALPESEAHLLCLDTEWDRITKLNDDNPAPIATADNLAYVIYTSGSTGKPKGVAIAHRSAVALIAWAERVFSGDELRVVLASTSICFDLSVFELFVTLCLGGRVVVAEDALELPQIADEITLVNTVPSAITELIRSSSVPPSVRTVNLAGEPLLNHLVQKIYQTETVDKVFNLYGPSEDTTYSTFALMQKGHSINSLVGRPIANTQVYLLDEHLQPVPVGVAGELYLGGDGLARGYLNRPDLTAAKFIPDPFSNVPGARLYATADRARYLADGNIEFLGRADNQVKIRGFRIELGEIETALIRHNQVHEVVVTAHEVGGDKRLVAYVVAVEGSQLTAADLRTFLSKDLPHFMTPSVFVMLDALPLTPNGKVDRRALPSPDMSDLGSAASFVTPRTPVEEVLAGIWSAVLRVERVGVEDNFFDLGGHSLLATQIISQVRQAFQIELPLRSLFEGPTIAQLARHVEQALQAGSESAPPIGRRNTNDNLPLSFAQQRLWFLDQLEPNSPAYNVPAAIRLEGQLDLAALEQSLNEIVKRHESLRTTFKIVNGEPVQSIASHAALKIEYVDLINDKDRETKAKQLAIDEARRPFDLSHGPLLRASVLRLAADEHVLLFTMHHIVSDGWSLTVLTNELASLYDAHRGAKLAVLPDLPVQYADFSLWQRNWLQGSVLEDQLAYWREQLQTVPPVIELPADHPRPTVGSLSAARRSFSLCERVTNDLRALSRGEGVTLFMTLLAAFQILLSRYSGQHDIAVGTPIANRNRAETENLIGFFVNTLVLRADLSGNPSVRELLRRVREVALGAYAHQDVPFEKLVEELQPERSLNNTPLFQVVFSLQNNAVQSLELEGLNVTLLESETGVSKFDLVFSLNETANSLEGSLEYSTDLFEAETVEQMLSHYRNVLSEIAADPNVHIEDVSLLSDEERTRIITEWNQTATPFPHDVTIQQLFESQARETPDAIALRFTGGQMTFGELNERANRLAHRLLRWGVGPEVVVALLVERSPEVVAALLAILKAGGAYLPLDPSSPPQRLAYMLNKARAKVLLTQQALLPNLPTTETPTLCLDHAWSDFKHESTQNPTSSARPENLAYVMYTSGSTGEPKGVSVSHRSVVRLVKNTNYARFGPDEVFLQYAPLSFDASTLELWGSLLNGAQLVVMPPGVAGLEDLGEVLQREKITTLWLTAGLFQQMVEQRLPDLKGVRQILAGGDVLSVEHVKQLLTELPDGAHLINGYGPTENTTFTCCHPMTASTPVNGSISIGKPISNTEVYVVDSGFRPVPRGVAGELLIGGEGLARGYWRSPELTAERFIPHPFKPGARLYRSGDRVRYRRNGELEFLGRLDQQVKLRGFRIEPGEIENSLNAHPAVRSSVVVLHSDRSRGRELVAYVVADQVGTEELRNHLLASLPPYMIPGVFVMLDELPLTANGKVDRAALPAPNDVQPEIAQEYVAPRNETEEQLASLWTTVLGRERIGVTDNFFELGGHSLLATNLVSRVRQTFQIEFPLRQLFESPTIAQLARLIDERKNRPKQVATIQARRRGARDFNQLLNQIENLSEDEVRRLLKETKLGHETGVQHG
ncbi:MAG TPA: amino acid adenylation domain-containing protein [Pyrinomonadaceae bacterium]|nr:amino acid adenylation domain-containing protein [Pyrinomonadaceae bacterium]